MRLTCPNCDASYEVGDGAIPEGGRQVQCSDCHEVWFQPGAAMAAGALAGAVMPEIAAGTAPEQRDSGVAQAQDVTPTFVSRRESATGMFDRDLAQELAAEAPVGNLEQSDVVEPEALNTDAGLEDLETGTDAASDPLAESVAPVSFEYESTISSDAAPLGEPEVGAFAENEFEAEPEGLPEAIVEAVPETVVEAVPEAVVETVPEAVQETDSETSVADRVEQMLAKGRSEIAVESETSAESFEDTAQQDVDLGLGEVDEALGDNIREALSTADDLADEAVSEAEISEVAADVVDSSGDAVSNTGGVVAGAVAAAAATTAAAIGSSPKMKSYSDLMGDTSERARDLTEVDNEALTRSLRDQIREAQDDEDALGDDYTRTKFEPAKRRATLPDANELNSSLRQGRSERKVEEPKKSGFMTGFLIALLLGCLAVAIYMFAPQLSEAIPQLAGPLESYVEMCDKLRATVSGFFKPAASPS